MMHTADAAHSAKVIMIIDNACVALDALITCEVTASPGIGKFRILWKGGGRQGRGH